MAAGVPRRRPRRAARRRGAPVGRPRPAAVVNAGATFPQRRITIGLSPAAMPKQGSGFDLAARGRGPGRLRRGAARGRSTGWCCSASSASTGPSAPSAGCCRPSSPRPGPVTRRWWCRRPTPTRRRWSRASRCWPATTLAEVVAHLAGRDATDPARPRPAAAGAAGARPGRRGRAGVGTAGRRGRGRRRAPPVPDRPAGRGQDDAGRAAARAAAAAGRAGGARGHRDPLGRRHAAARGAAGPAAHLRGAAPLGHDGVAGRRRARGRSGPGALCRAHRGVLFLDEAPEFPRTVLDTLRQPLERGSVTIHRAAGSATFPCRAQLVLAANPCPCATRGGRHRLHVQPAGAAALPVAAVRPAARPDRPAGRSPAGHPGGLAGRRGAAGDHRGRRRPGRRRAGRRGPPAGRHRAVGEQPGPRPAAARAVGGAPGRRCGWPSGRWSAARCRSAGFDRVLRVAWTLADLAGRAVPGRRRGGRGARHAAAAGRGMTLDEDLEDAAASGRRGRCTRRCGGPAPG